MNDRTLETRPADTADLSSSATTIATMNVGPVDLDALDGHFQPPNVEPLIPGGSHVGAQKTTVPW